MEGVRIDAWLGNGPEQNMAKFPRNIAHCHRMKPTRCTLVHLRDDRPMSLFIANAFFPLPGKRNSVSRHTTCRINATLVSQSPRKRFEIIQKLVRTDRVSRPQR